MMMDGNMGYFGFVFMFLYLGAVIYFFVLLSKIANALERIANK